MKEAHSYLPEADKLHLSRLMVSASAIRHNLSFFRQLLAKETGIMLVVKASAYGNGALEIAQLVQEEKLVEYLAVADVDEGIELRKAGIELPILILNPSRLAFQELVEYCLEPEIHHLSLLVDFEAYLCAAKLNQGNYPVHLKFNTGMNRFGLELNELEQVKSLIKNRKGWEVRSVMTHLSCSGDPSEDEFSLKQLSLFKEVVESLKTLLPDSCFFHPLNSDGIFRFPEHHYQMVRLGIGVYGATSVPALKKQLKPVCRFTCRISQTRKVKKGASIGYGRKGMAEKDTNIATLAIGYADGLNRNLSDGRWQVEINQKLYPIIGTICMDITMVDLGDDWYEPQTEVTIFGGVNDIHEYAKAQGTITYEAMTNISARVKRMLID
ncbi:MAG: alanine racemase [Vicingaceae bacterium]